VVVRDLPQVLDQRRDVVAMSELVIEAAAPCIISQSQTRTCE
jgi:hypothetical protein